MRVSRLLCRTALVWGVILSTVSPAFADGVVLFATLSGGHEVTPAGDASAGDTNGWGSATIMIRNSTQLCYAILVTGITAPTAAHIHEARAGANGGIAQGLTPPPSGNPGRVSGCLTPDDTDLVRRLRSNPSNFYVNVHNGDFPNGAVRGQLH